MVLGNVQTFRWQLVSYSHLEKLPDSVVHGGFEVDESEHGLSPALVVFSLENVLGDDDVHLGDPLLGRVDLVDVALVRVRLGLDDGVVGGTAVVGTHLRKGLPAMV